MSRIWYASVWDVKNKNKIVFRSYNIKNPIIIYQIIFVFHLRTKSNTSTSIVHATMLCLEELESVVAVSNHLPDNNWYNMR